MSHSISKLDRQTARAIVERTMQIIPHSVDVMDEKGVIIASGEPSRVGERRAGALTAPANAGETEAVSAKPQHDAAREGLNLPIRYLGKTVGVIGIAGKPEEVRRYGELVAMAAELMVEGAALSAKEHRQQRYKEEFMHELLHGGLSREETERRAAFFQLNVAGLLSAVIIKLKTSDSDSLQSIQELLAQHPGHVASAVVASDKIVSLLTAEDPLRLRNACALSELLPESERYPDVKIIVGAPVPHLHSALLSYRTALQTLAYAEQTGSDKRTLFFEDDKLAALLAEFARSWQSEELLAPFKALAAQDGKAVLFNSLQQYFRSNCDLAQAAEKLCIHPNTLRYRLEKIEQITALSFNKIEDKFMFYLATVLLP